MLHDVLILSLAQTCSLGGQCCASLSCVGKGSNTIIAQQFLKHSHGHYDGNVLQHYHTLTCLGSLYTHTAMHLMENLGYNSFTDVTELLHASKDCWTLIAAFPEYRVWRGWGEGGLPVNAGHDWQHPGRRLCLLRQVPCSAGGLHQAALPWERPHQLHVPLHQRPLQVHHRYPSLPSLVKECFCLQPVSYVFGVSCQALKSLAACCQSQLCATSLYRDNILCRGHIPEGLAEACELEVMAPDRCCYLQDDRHGAGEVQR